MEAVVEQWELFPNLRRFADRQVSRLDQFLDAVDRHGALIPQAMVHGLVDLSKQRVSVLIREGRIASLKIGGRVFVPVAALELFLSEERKDGRPVTEKIDIKDYRESVERAQRKFVKKNC